MAGGRNVNIGGNVSQSSIVSGDHNRIESSQGSLPPVSELRAEIAELHRLLAALEPPDERKMLNALDDAETETAKADPDRDELAAALERALGYARQASGFAEHSAEVAGHVTRLAAWLGAAGSRLLSILTG